MYTNIYIYIFDKPPPPQLRPGAPCRVWNIGLIQVGFKNLVKGFKRGNRKREDNRRSLTWGTRVRRGEKNIGFDLKRDKYDDWTRIQMKALSK
jgi:hypothetical protein